jgi:hypothetical protein
LLPSEQDLLCNKSGCDTRLCRPAEELHEEARHRAVVGDLVPIFYNGVQCGTVRRKSDRLLRFLLQLEMPEKYDFRRSRAKAGPPADLAERLKEGQARVAKFRAEERAEQERKARAEGPA